MTENNDVFKYLETEFKNIDETISECTKKYLETEIEEKVEETVEENATIEEKVEETETVLEESTDFAHLGDTLSYRISFKDEFYDNILVKYSVGNFRDKALIYVCVDANDSLERYDEGRIIDNVNDLQKFIKMANDNKQGLIGYIDSENVEILKPFVDSLVNKAEEKYRKYEFKNPVHLVFDGEMSAGELQKVLNWFDSYEFVDAPEQVLVDSISENEKVEDEVVAESVSDVEECEDEPVEYEPTEEIAPAVETEPVKLENITVDEEIDRIENDLDLTPKNDLVMRVFIYESEIDKDTETLFIESNGELEKFSKKMRMNGFSDEDSVKSWFYFSNDKE